MNNGCWSEELQCDWDAWRVVGDGHLALDLPDYNSCDMTGAIKIAEYLYPGVDKIDVFSGGKPDIRYRRNQGAWKAFR